MAPEQLTREYLDAKVAEALEEDGALHDLTTGAVVPAELRAEAELVAKAAGVVAGLVVAEAVFRQVDPSVELTATVADASTVKAGESLARVHGPLGSLLRGERVALNFLQQLSGVATLTRSFVRKRGDNLIGHAPVRTQFTWCAREGIPRAIITHCGSEIVTGDESKIEKRLRAMAFKRGVKVALAYDGMRLTLP